MKLKSIRSSHTRASWAHSEAKRSASTDIKKKKKVWHWYDRVDAFLRPYTKSRVGESNLVFITFI